MRYAIYVLSVILLFTGCGRPSSSTSSHHAFEAKTFLGLKIGMTKNDVTRVLESSGLPYQIEESDPEATIQRSKQSLINQGDTQLANAIWGDNAEMQQTAKRIKESGYDCLKIRVKGNARLKGMNLIIVWIESWKIREITVENIFLDEEKKEKADRTYDALLTILKKEKGKPELEITRRGNVCANWIMQDEHIILRRSFDWDRNCFIVATTKMTHPPGGAKKSREILRNFIQPEKDLK
ncbi:MAG: hypothetical protein PF904_04500 [Kiritimatiellae bacterium]|nr:hypothetical protein [Kiritimatiellia bacterium]